MKQSTHCEKCGIALASHPPDGVCPDPAAAASFDVGYFTGGMLALEAARELAERDDLLGAALHARMAADQFVLIIWGRERAQDARDAEVEKALSDAEEPA